MASHPPQPAHATACLILEDGTIFWGRGIGLEQNLTGELCFNTSMTGYQEILTDPSYTGQVITFTFPHIGNTGVNTDDIESDSMAAKGLILRNEITTPSSYRATDSLQNWLVAQKRTGISGIDTRHLTQHLRDKGAQNAVISYREDKNFDLESLKAELKQAPSMKGQDIAKSVTCAAPYEWTKGAYFDNENQPTVELNRHVIVVDYGVKRNILRMLVDQGCRLTVVPCTTTADEILEYDPDGIFLSNGPGDPAATAAYASPEIQKLIASGLPLFGICLGHQLLALALGGQTRKLDFGHRGANHPVKNLETGLVEITSQNHGFVVINESLPETVVTTHLSLFDGTNEGLRIKDKPVFSVQHHPEASPGPEDSHYLFNEFITSINKQIKKAA
ncbi:MAG: glutamine-hydrolyzing carbamoyl-phosphate synthase small subunit [Pseudomonadota bacterium]